MRLRVSIAHYPQSNGMAECVVKAAKNLVANNITGFGALDTDRFLCANLAYHNSMIYPDTGKSIAQSLLGRHLRYSLPAVREFYQIKKEFVMERKKREIVAAKVIRKMVESYDRGSKILSMLSVGDIVRVQNQTTTRTIKWDKNRVVTKLLSNRKYEIIMDGSCCITIRNRRHLRRIPGKKVELKEEEEQVPSEETSVQVPVQEPPVLVLEPSVPVQSPVEDVPSETQDIPRRSVRSRSGPDRLVVTGKGKRYAETVKEKPGKPRGKGNMYVLSTCRTWHTSCVPSPM